MRHTVRETAAGVLLSLLLGCGTRTSLPSEATRTAGGDGGDGGGNTHDSSSASGGANSSAQTTTGGGGDCTARNLDLEGTGALRLQTVGEVVFYSTVDGSVVRGDLETGEERVLVSGKQSLGDIAIYDGFLYFSDFSSISRVPLDGGAESVVVDVPSTSYALAVDATGIYWIEGPSSLASHTIERRLPDGSRLTLATNVQFPFGLSLGPAGVVFTDPYDWSAPAGTVRSVGIDGTAPTLVASSVPYPELPFQRDGFIYWVEATDEVSTNHGGIGRIPVGGGAREKVLALDGLYPVFGMTDGSHYFMTVLDEDIDSQLIAAGYPIAREQTVVARGGADAYFTMVATTPKRLVWTAQPATGESPPLDGVRSLCLDAIPFL